jgi:hypothetical protein
MANARKKAQKSGKRERIPFGGQRLKLKVPEGWIRDGYVGRWVNDTESRLVEAEAGGYEFVRKNRGSRLGEGELHRDNSDLNSRVSVVVSKGQEAPIRAFLMEIKKAWYDADQKVKQKVNDEVDQAIMRGRAGGAAIENQYTPKQGGVTLQRP